MRLTSDRCKRLIECDFTNEYESELPGVVNDRTCTPLTICNTEEFETTIPTPTSDRICTALTVCDNELQYESNEFRNKYTDRICDLLTVCDYDNEYESIPNTETSDRTCTPLTICDETTEYESTPKTETSDRICSQLTICDETEYETTPKTYTSDRECEPLTICDYDNEYESIPNTETSDRTCTPLTICDETEYESTPKTDTTDRICSPLTECSILEYITTPATETTDLICGPLTICNDNEYEINPDRDEFTDRECSVVTNCTENQYEFTSETSSEDKVCLPLTECTETQYETVAPTLISDRVCSEMLCNITENDIGYVPTDPNIEIFELQTKGESIACAPGFNGIANAEPCISEEGNYIPGCCNYSGCNTGSRCEINEYVLNNECIPCPQGYTNEGGNNPALSDTSCEPLICTRPSDTRGYNIVDNQLDISIGAFDVDVSCKKGYTIFDKADAIPCTESGPYELRGCVPIPREMTIVLNGSIEEIQGTHSLNNFKNLFIENITSILEFNTSDEYSEDDIKIIKITEGSIKVIFSISSYLSDDEIMSKISNSESIAGYSIISNELTNSEKDKERIKLIGISILVISLIGGFILYKVLKK